MILASAPQKCIPLQTGHDQGHAHRLVVDLRSVSDQTVLSEGFTVIRNDHDQRLLEQAAAAQRLYEQPQAPIHVPEAVDVGATQVRKRR